MKRSFSSLTIALFFSLLGSLSTAHAQTAPENVVVAVDLEVSKCVTSGTTASCDAVSSMPTNIAIPLSSCTNSGSETFCSGSWTKSQIRDGYAFDASISVTKNTNLDGTANYNLMSSVGPTLNSNTVPHSSVDIYLNNGKVTDSVRFSSAPLVLAKDVKGNTTSYVPSLLIGPAVPTN